MECGGRDAALVSGRSFVCKSKSRCTSGLAPQSIGGRGNPGAVDHESLVRPPTVKESSDRHFRSRALTPTRPPPGSWHQVTCSQQFIANWVRLVRKVLSRQMGLPAEGVRQANPILPIAPSLRLFTSAVQSSTFSLLHSAFAPSVPPCCPTPGPCSLPVAAGHRPLKRRYGPKTPKVGNQYRDLLRIFCQVLCQIPCQLLCQSPCRAWRADHPEVRRTDSV